MNKAKRSTIEVQGASIGILSQPGVWERINNPDFNEIAITQMRTLLSANNVKRLN